MAIATKTCEKCGWVYPITHPDARCKFCGTLFKKRFCIDCGIYTDIVPNEAVCHKCKSKRCMQSYDTVRCSKNYTRYIGKMRADSIKQFDEWLGLIAAVPKPYTMLTEDDWIAACRYFGNCALCGDERIDARSFFIPFALGGRYTAWNVIPVCEKCANTLVTKQNPFLRYHWALSMHPHDLTRIVDYLKPKLKGACQNDSGSKGS